MRLQGDTGGVRENTVPYLEAPPYSVVPYSTPPVPITTPAKRSYPSPSLAKL
jgi:hypothetical protein